MTLKEEIGNIVYEEVDGYDVTFGDTMTKLTDLFKKKMLEFLFNQKGKIVIGSVTREQLEAVVEEALKE